MEKGEKGSLDFRTKKLLTTLWPFLVVWGVGYAIQVVFTDPLIDFIAGLGLVATFAVFAWWINKKLKLIENFAKSDRYHVSGNMQFLRMVVFATVGMLLIEAVTDYLDIYTAGIPMMVLVGIILTGYMVGYFPKMPKDNEFRGKK